MQINIDKSKFYVLVGLLVIMISVVVYASGNQEVLSGTNDKNSFGHDFKCVTVTSDEDNNVHPNDIGAPNSFFDHLDVNDDDNAYVLAVYCPETYTAVGGGMYTYENDETKVEVFIDMPTKGIKDYFNQGGIDKNAEGWVCAHDDLTQKATCSVVCCRLE